MGTYIPDMDYSSLREQRHYVHLADLLGGATAEKARALYGKKIDLNGDPSKPYRQNQPLVFYAKPPVYGQMDPMTRVLTGYNGNPDLQPDLVNARRAAARR